MLVCSSCRAWRTSTFQVFIEYEGYSHTMYTLADDATRFIVVVVQHEYQQHIISQRSAQHETHGAATLAGRSWGRKQGKELPMDQHERLSWLAPRSAAQRPSQRLDARPSSRTATGVILSRGADDGSFCRSRCSGGSPSC